MSGRIKTNNAQCITVSANGSLNTAKDLITAAMLYQTFMDST